MPSPVRDSVVLHRISPFPTYVRLLCSDFLVYDRCSLFPPTASWRFKCRSEAKEHLGNPFLAFTESGPSAHFSASFSLPCTMTDRRKELVKNWIRAKLHREQKTPNPTEQTPISTVEL
ncbi:hypothetical protein DFH09DRAFT_1070418 [Mycena vulgaris]|nr:hypothetical protein DFH09DRAFT_1070418 [Mycena vulgaris]